MHCVGLAYDVSLRQMIDNKVDSHLKGLINHYLLLLLLIRYEKLSVWGGQKSQSWRFEGV